MILFALLVEQSQLLGGLFRCSLESILVLLHLCSLLGVLAVKTLALVAVESPNVFANSKLISEQNLHLKFEVLSHGLDSSALDRLGTLLLL